MKRQLGGLITRIPALRRVAWRAGRSLYMASRQEQSSDDIATNGERDLIRRAVAGVPANEKLHVVDIGGNQGDWSREVLLALPEARKASTGVKIDIFEPVAALHERLVPTITTTGLAELCEVHAVAMSDRKGHVDLGVMSEHGGTNSIHYAADSENSCLRVLSVPTTSLTEFCDDNRIGHVHLAKSDTEGHDLSVLLGAKGLIDASRIDVLQFEYNHRWVFARSYLRDAFELIAGKPYRIAKVQPETLDVFEAWHPELERFFPGNYAILSERALAWFQIRQGGFDAANTFG